MRILLLLLIGIEIISCSTSITRNDAEIYFYNMEYDLGTISFNKDTAHIFEFTNPGNIPLLILDIKTSCGCTAAKWNKVPIKPGNSGKIQVQYDSATPGIFNKEIKVYYNGQGSPAVLRIKGQVEYPVML